MIQSGQNLVWFKGSKPEPSASGLDSRNDFTHVVTNQAETDVVSEFLNN